VFDKYVENNTNIFLGALEIGCASNWRGLVEKLIFIVILKWTHCVQFFAYKMTVESKNSMLKHRNVDLNTVSL
jgi:hypothetical protein